MRERGKNRQTREKLIKEKKNRKREKERERQRERERERERGRRSDYSWRLIGGVFILSHSPFRLSPLPFITMCNS